MNLGHRLAVIERDDARREVVRLRAENDALRELLGLDVELDLRDPARATAPRPKARR